MNLSRMPAAFVGHGTPMNALASNSYTKSWRRFAESIRKPEEILVVSAHWYTEGVGVTAMEQPRTIHDFFGFPQELFDIQYATRGSPALAKRVQKALEPLSVHADNTWGIDHGAWSILMHMFPNADIPVVQLSIDGTRPAKFHYELGSKLNSLRDEVVLVLGSGNVVHNLSLMQRTANAPPYEWAERFNREVFERVQNKNHAELVQYESFGESARLSVPTPEHYLPLLYILGLQRDDDDVSMIVDGIDLGSISMLSFAIGNLGAQL